MNRTQRWSRGSFEDFNRPGSSTRARTQELKRRKRARPKVACVRKSSSKRRRRFELMRSTCESISLRRTSSSPSNYIIHAPFLNDLSRCQRRPGDDPESAALSDHQPAARGSSGEERIVRQINFLQVEVSFGKSGQLTFSALVFTFQGRPATRSSFSLSWESGRLLQLPAENNLDAQGPQFNYCCLTCWGWAF